MCRVLKINVFVHLEWSHLSEPLFASENLFNQNFFTQGVHPSLRKKERKRRNSKVHFARITSIYFNHRTQQHNKQHPMKKNHPKAFINMVTRTSGDFPHHSHNSYNQLQKHNKQHYGKDQFHTFSFKGKET